MIITKASLPRRTVLRGLGASLALPLLDAMAPALSAAAGGVSRVAFIYAPNGCIPANFHPKTAGANFEMTPVLKPLEPFRKQITVLGGLSNKPAENLGEGGGPHTRVHASWLTGVRPRKTEGGDIEEGTSVDQLIAAQIGKESPLPSLQIALEQDSVGRCENGYACVYLNTFSWRAPTSPAPMESNPRMVFERLFGDGGTAAEQRAHRERDKSVLDLMKADMTRLNRKLGARDRTTVDEYLQAVRDVEQRIQRAEARSQTTPLAAPDQPAGVPDSFDEHAKLMFDLMFLGFKADITRVASFQIARELSVRTYPQIGVTEGHHTVSHHQNDPDRMATKTKIDIYHMTLLTHLLGKMRDTPDGDRSLLDRSILVYGGGMGDSDLHNPVNLPIVVAGGGNGHLEGGRYIRCPDGTPWMNVLLTVANKVGAPIERIGNSTGVLEL